MRCNVTKLSKHSGYPSTDTDITGDEALADIAVAIESGYELTTRVRPIAGGWGERSITVHTTESTTDYIWEERIDHNAR